MLHIYCLGSHAGHHVLFGVSCRAANIYIYVATYLFVFVLFHAVGRVWRGAKYSKVSFVCFRCCSTQLGGSGMVQNAPWSDLFVFGAAARSWEGLAWCRIFLGSYIYIYMNIINYICGHVGPSSFLS